MRWADDGLSEERATLARFNRVSDDGPVKVRAHCGLLRVLVSEFRLVQGWTEKKRLLKRTAATLDICQHTVHCNALNVFD